MKKKRLIHYWINASKLAMFFLFPDFSNAVLPIISVNCAAVYARHLNCI